MIISTKYNDFLTASKANLTVQQCQKLKIKSTNTVPGYAV